MGVGHELVADCGNPHGNHQLQGCLQELEEYISELPRRDVVVQHRKRKT